MVSIYEFLGWVKYDIIVSVNALLRNIRFYILLFSLSISAGIYFWVIYTIPEGTLQIIRLTQFYAFAAVIYLYIALLIGPLCYQVRWIPKRPLIVKSRRAIGVSAFYFALLHASFAFFGQLGGFSGLFYLANKYLIAVSLSATALLILSLMAATSFDYFTKYSWWKKLHRFVYVAGVFVLVHALMLGTHFQNLSDLIPQISFVLLSFLLILEGRRVDAYLKERFSKAPSFNFGMLFVCILIGLGLSFYILPQQPNGTSTFSVHSEHIKIAQQAQNMGAGNQGNQNVTSLVGDRTKRYSVSFDHSENVRVATDTTLSFRVHDASNGNPVVLFSPMYEKQMHLIIVDSQLEYYSHIHPEQEGSTFSITTQFPKNGVYHLYTDFQPVGAIEQQFAFTLPVGNGEPILSQKTPDTNLTKQFDDYTVTLSHEGSLSSNLLSTGKQELTFTLRDNAGNPVTTLHPYLASFGHLVMINQETFDYIHVHPTNTTAPKPDDRSGPDVSFLPLGLYGPIKPGTYRVFAQFNPNGKLILADYTVKVQ